MQTTSSDKPAGPLQNIRFCFVHSANFHLDQRIETTEIEEYQNERNNNSYGEYT